jgi:hypothetical protein
MTKANTDTVDLKPEQRIKIVEKMATCPFVGTAVATNQLRVLNNAENPLASIKDIEELGNSGGGDLETHILKLFARGNHSIWITPMDLAGKLVPTGTFSLQFGGSQGIHFGHSGILLGDPYEVNGGRFDHNAFERLTNHADRNGRLSIDSIGDFISDNLKRDPDTQVLPLSKLIEDTFRLFKEFKDVVLRGDDHENTEEIQTLTKLLGENHLVASAGEWGLLFAFLKNSPSSDDGDIALLDVKELFVGRRLPEGWETWKKTALSWINATLGLTKHVALAYYFGLNRKTQ